LAITFVGFCPFDVLIQLTHFACYFPTFTLRSQAIVSFCLLAYGLVDLHGCYKSRPKNWEAELRNLHGDRNL